MTTRKNFSHTFSFFTSNNLAIKLMTEKYIQSQWGEVVNFWLSVIFPLQRVCKHYLRIAIGLVVHICQIERSYKPEKLQKAELNQLNIPGAQSFISIVK